MTIFVDIHKYVYYTENSGNVDSNYDYDVLDDTDKFKVTF